MDHNEAYKSIMYHLPPTLLADLFAHLYSSAADDKAFVMKIPIEVLENVVKHEEMLLQPPEVVEFREACYTQLLNLVGEDETLEMITESQYNVIAEFAFDH